MHITILGTGYVGLTTATAFAYLGHQVTAVDIDDEKIARLAQGECPIHEPHLPETLALARPRLRFTTDPRAAISEADIVFITVGTPSRPDGRPDLDQVQAAARAIGENLGPRFTVIVNKSTVPIGSGNWVDSLIRDALPPERETSFAVASNPEFLRQGAALEDSFFPDRVVVGADDSRALETLAQLYKPILKQRFEPPAFLPRPIDRKSVPLITTDLASAELIKYSANAFLAAKISFINEIADLAEKIGADALMIAKAIGLDERIGTRFLEPGLGWGGSCFGKDTAALAATARDYGLTMRIVEAAREANYQRRAHIVEMLQAELKILNGRKVTLLGLAFKPHTDDLRDAPSIDLALRLSDRGVRVRAHDPVAIERAKAMHPEVPIDYFDSAERAVEGADAVVLVTDWPQYRKLDWQALGPLMRGKLVLDARNYLDREIIEKAGLRYLGVGR